MDTFQMKSCRICGSEITIDTQICPLCSSPQETEKRYRSTGIILFLAVSGFFGIMLLGIMSAHAIQQFIGIRTEACNSCALKSIRSAKTGLDTYFTTNDRFPETFNKLHCKPDDGVTILFEKTAENKYKLISFHVQGDREYLTFSGDAKIFFRKKNLQRFRYFSNDITDSRFVTLKE